MSVEFEALFQRIEREMSQAAAYDADKKRRRLRRLAVRLQLDFIDDPSDRKTLLCSRRAGKSYAAALYLYDVALANKADCLYIAVTRGHAKEILWRHLKALNDELELGASFNNTDLRIELPTGSTIRLSGAETAHDVDKFRGQAFDLVIVDECASFPTHIIEELIWEVLEYCLADRAGTLCLIGTPGAILEGTFWKATSESAFYVETDEEGERRATSRPYAEREAKKWDGVKWTFSHHEWSTADNPKTRHIWERMLKSHKASGQSDQDPRWLREASKKWIADDRSLVYRYDPQRNGYVPDTPTETNPFGLPEGHEWKFICGVDLGYDDDFDLEVAAYSETCDTFYHVYGFASPGLSVADMAREIKRTEEMFGGFEVIVGDRAGLGKTIFASLADTYGIAIEPADKHDKRDFIELLNSDLLAGRCKILRGSTLEGQMRILQWDEKKRREDKHFANHACDAFLYLVRWAMHHFTRARAQELVPGTPEWDQKMDDEAFERTCEERKRRLRRQWWEDVRLDEGFEGLYSDPYEEMYH